MARWITVAEPKTESVSRVVRVLELPTPKGLPTMPPFLSSVATLDCTPGEIFYYKTEDMQCAPCPGAPECAQCDPDDPDTCVLYKQNVANCADMDDWGVCNECEDNYTLTKKNGKQKCVKCKAANCYQCTSDGKKCKKCQVRDEGNEGFSWIPYIAFVRFTHVHLIPDVQWGYGANKKGCSKCPSKCGECDTKGRCTRCYAGYAVKSGKCKKCPNFGNTSCGFDGTTCKC